MENRKPYRLNVALSPENRAFVGLLSKSAGTSMTAAINAVLDRYRAEHPEIAAQAEALQAALITGDALPKVSNGD